MMTVAQPDTAAALVVTLSGVITPTDLKAGLLAIVRENAWQHPVLWDLRQAEQFAGTDADFHEVVAFAQRHMAHFPHRGRIAVLAPEPHVRELALRYLDAWDGRAQHPQMAVVETLEAAQAWLASDETGDV